jgi:hypothetical protein
MFSLDGTDMEADWASAKEVRFLQRDYLNEAIDRLPVKPYPAAAFALEIAKAHSV